MAVGGSRFWGPTEGAQRVTGAGPDDDQILVTIFDKFCRRRVELRLFRNIQRSQFCKVVSGIS